MKKEKEKEEVERLTKGERSKHDQFWTPSNHALGVT